VTISLAHTAATPAHPRAVRHRQELRVYPDGHIEFSNTFVADKRLPDLPRLGVGMVLPAGFEDLRWYGRGPHENYRDRNRSAMVDLHASTVAEQYVPYILPQEHGNHTDVRWLELRSRFAGLRVDARGPLEFSASHFTAEDLFKSTHTHQLTPRAETFLNLDCLHSGVGTGSCGPATLPQYCVQTGRHDWAWTLTFLPPDRV